MSGEGPLSDDLQALQKSKIVEVLGRVGGNKTRAARLLGITRRSLYRLLERYDLGDHPTKGRPSSCHCAHASRQVT
jgi:DNA-binding NtrC family response regulator